MIGRHERVLWANPFLVLGSFDVSPRDEDFATAGAIGGRPTIAFAHAAVRIEPDHGTPFVSDATIATLHNPHHIYRRSAVDPRGDHCEWISLAPELLFAVNPRLEGKELRPFERPHSPLDRRSNALLRLVVRHLRECSPPDVLFVEESLIEALFRVLDPDESATSRGRGRARARHYAIVERARELFGWRFGERWTVSRIAREVGCSPFHLSRVFRGLTGFTMHSYLTELRLRAALLRLADHFDDLLEIATELGFSSHSHFTALFGRAFGFTPSEFRRSASAEAVRDLRRRLAAGAKLSSRASKDLITAEADIA